MTVVPFRYPILYEPGWLAERVAEGSSMASLARELGCSLSTIRYAADRLNVTIPTTPPRVDQLRDPVWLRSRLDAGLTIRDIAAELGCGKTTVHKAIISSIGPRPRPARHLLHDPEWLQAQLAAGSTQKSMAEAAGCSPKAIRDALDRFALRPRSGTIGGFSV